MDVLVAEDDNRSRIVFDRLLEMKGYSVSMAKNGYECLEMYKERIDSKKNSFDIVMLDYAMPKIDGIKVIQKIKSWNPNQRMILMTAYTRELISKIPKEIENIPFIEKPISFHKLIDAIEGNHTKTAVEEFKKIGIKEWNNLGELETPPKEKTLSLN